MKRQELYLLFIFIAFSSCLQSPEMITGIINEKEKPTVVTGQSTPFINGDGNLVFQGEITSKGKSDIIEKGFYWNTDSIDPGMKVIVSDTDSSVFTYELQHASGEQTYYWRAYAINSFGCDTGEIRSCQTPAIWMEKQELPADSRGNGAVFMLSNKVYITCGMKIWGQALVNDTWEYSISANQWVQADSMSFIGAFRVYPAVFTIGNLAFVGMGFQSSGIAHKDLYQFSADLKKWTQITTPDNLTARYKAAAFSLNGRGYIIGGYSSDNMELNDVWQYNPNGDVWEQKNNFPVYFSGGISIYGDNRAFTGFGETSESARTLWEYDQTTDSYIEFAKLPDEITTKIYSGVIVQNAIYIVDGNNQIWALNMSDTTWTKKSGLPMDFLGYSGYQTLLTTDSSNAVYVGLGFSNLLYQYNPLWDN